MTTVSGGGIKPSSFSQFGAQEPRPLASTVKVADKISSSTRSLERRRTPVIVFFEMNYSNSLR
ncbi:MAG: hypothetical protein ACRC2R_00180 [Xenococcaceae cyanobacterium]